MDITPDKQNIGNLFSNITYHIDFYQREYKWNEQPVKRLLEDIFYKFNMEYKPSLDANEETVSRYSWYYLNTYVTNQTGGKVYVVDGQQRLTTITLILLKLYHTAKNLNSGLDEWLKNKIIGVHGRERRFWMNHKSHIITMQGLFEGLELSRIDTSSGITAQNMVKNYKTISDWVNEHIETVHKLDTFIFYFLNRLVMINLSVVQTDVPMVFEVINDRGVKLKPYEILKGKLLGQIEKLELENLKLNELWESQVRMINAWNEDKMDDFFRVYLKSKFVNSRSKGTKFDGDYHRELFTGESNEDSLQLKDNPTRVKYFLQNDFKYYTNLYNTILKYYDKHDEDQPYIFFNSLNDMDTQITLMLSACNLEDKKGEEKLRAISRELDRYYILLQLQKAYDSNDFNASIYEISSDIRGKDIDTYRDVFDKNLMKQLTSRKGVEVTEPFQYGYFKNIGYLDFKSGFLKYFFARIEKFVADGAKMNTASVRDMVKTRGHKNGYHVEHILAYNDENYKLFGNDEDLFEQQRNRLGGLLLLKGRDNISSSNEVYEKKLNTYANTLIWNTTLREDTYKSKLDLSDFIKKHNLKFESISEFGRGAVEARHQLLFEMVKIIWK